HETRGHFPFKVLPFTRPCRTSWFLVHYSLTNDSAALLPLSIRSSPQHHPPPKSIMFNLLAISFILPLLLPSTSATDCECYRTSTGQYFTDYEFHDFRKLSGPLSPIPEL